QLCAQALCLEEMLSVRIPEGALFYGQPRRRQSVAFTPELRTCVEENSRKLHRLIDTGQTPPAVYEKKCQNCSLFDQCRPHQSGHPNAVREYIQKQVFS
ncbi:MAG: Dna2/Cas4 domain-containing protein, partial [Lentisphaerota bacterium]